jgi:hypothetical protein
VSTATALPVLGDGESSRRTAFHKAKTKLHEDGSSASSMASCGGARNDRSLRILPFPGTLRQRGPQAFPPFPPPLREGTEGTVTASGRTPQKRTPT